MERGSIQAAAPAPPRTEPDPCPHQLPAAAETNPCLRPHLLLAIPLPAYSLRHQPLPKRPTPRRQIWTWSTAAAGDSTTQERVHHLRASRAQPARVRCPPPPLPATRAAAHNLPAATRARGTTSSHLAPDGDLPRRRRPRIQASFTGRSLWRRRDDGGARMERRRR